MDRFRNIRLLGAGGVAEVWLAFDRRRREQVALKILRPHYAQDEGLWRRLRREANLIATLESPHIVRFFGLEETDDGAPVLVMEYVPGADLKVLLKLEGVLEPTRALRLLRQIASGAAAAHRAGLVHRDLKPANILITPDGTPKITDFGIAHETAGAALTEPEQAWGTSAYLAPEQASGNPVTPASDIYSLGVILFEMLTGKVPFPGDDPIQVALAHIQKSAPSVHTVNPLIPPGVEQLVARMLAKAPGERPRDGDALVTILDRYIEGGDNPTLFHDGESLAAMRSVRSAAVPHPARHAPTPRRARLSWVVALLALLILAGGFTVSQSDRLRAAFAFFPDPAAGKEVAIVPTPTQTATPTPSPTPTPLPTRREGNGTDALAAGNAAILVDGSLGEWNAIAPVPVQTVIRGESEWRAPADLSGGVRFAWDANNLYIAIERRDERHVQTVSGAELGNGDAVEIWLDSEVGADFDSAAMNGDDFHILLSAGDFMARRAEAYVAHPPEPAERHRSVRVRAAPLPNGYTLEASIAWELLGVTPRANLTLGYAVVLSDIDDPDVPTVQSQLATTPTDPFQNPLRFGNLTLLEPANP